MKKLLLLTLIIIIICVTGFGLFIHGKSAGFINIFHEETENFHIVKINGFELEQPFFGIAFHLHYDEKLFEFDHYTLGDYFESDDTPLTMVSKYKNKPKIIAGISLKRGNLIHKKEGDFLNLYFRKKSEEPDIFGFVFEEGIFSTFDKERRDVENVEFGSI